MQVLAQSQLLSQKPISRAVNRKAVTARAAVKTDSRTSTSTDIYIGKGKFIKDDPRKYPGKEDLGLFAGATGGWAGGETALWQLREDLKSSKAASKATGPASNLPPKVNAKGKSAIYIGKSKGFIVDDPRKYPAKEDVAFMAGATGGFAGGEKGLKYYVESGEVSLRDNGIAGPTQYSPLTFSFLLVAAGVGGGLILNSVLEAGKGVVVEEVVLAPIDDSTKTLLLLALGLLGSVAAITGARAALNSVKDKLREGAEKLVVNAGFFFATLLAASAVLQN